MKYCRECGIKIPKARLKVLPDTEYCVKCSNVEEAGEWIPGGPSLAEMRRYKEMGHPVNCPLLDNDDGPLPSTLRDENGAAV